MPNRTPSPIRGRIALAVLAGALLAAGLSPAAAAFDDVPAGAFFEDPVDWMAEQGITTGKTPTIFDPYAPVTRAESATFIWRYGSRPDGTSNPFTDVDEGRFFTEAVKWMKDSEITTGKSPTIFDPFGEVTRGEIATFLWRYMCKPAGTSNPFTDVPEGRFFTEPVKWMVDEGITTGKSPTIFDPNASVTRGELATFVWRLAGKPSPSEDGDNRVSLAPDCDGTPPPPPPGVGALSVSPTSFALGDIDVTDAVERTLTITNTGAAGGPALAVTAFDSDDTDVTTSAGVLALDPGESADVTVTIEPASIGSDSATLTVRHAGSNGPATAVPVTWTAEPKQVHKINAGGPAVAGGWTADTLASPSALHNMTGSRNRTGTTLDAITGGSAPEAVYQSSRIDIQGSLEMEWDLPVPTPGLYLVRLHFAEIVGSPDRQTVAIEGNPVLDNFDVGEEAGGVDTALVRSFVVTADDAVDIDFSHVYKLNDIHVAGIEVIGLGESPTGYLTASPSRADLGSVEAGVGTNTVEIMVTNLDSAAVSIPSIPATVGDFDPDVTSLVVPAGGTASFDVDFSTTELGVHSAWLPLAHTEDPDFGVHLRGHGGATGTASVEVLAEKFNEDASVFSDGAIAIRNNSVSTDIASITVSLGGALLDGLEFDLDDAAPISGGEKDFTADFGDVTVTTDTTTDGTAATASFSGFGPGETLHMSVDIDPRSSQGMTGDNHSAIGPVSGLEMVGATVSVTFAGGPTVTGPLWTDGYPAGGAVVVKPGAAPAAPTIVSVLPVGPDPEDHEVTVSCPATARVELVQIHSDRYLIGQTGSPPTPDGGNRLLEILEPSAPATTREAICGAGGATFAVELADTLPSDATDGFNHFMVRRGAADATGAVSSRFVIQYES